MFFTWDKIKEISREIKRMPFEGISDELRGWSWSEPPVAPVYNVKMGISDIVTGYCDSGRNVYLKYVERVREKPTPILNRGSIVHIVRERAISTAKKLIYSLEELNGLVFYESFMNEKEGLIGNIKKRFGEESLQKYGWIIDKIWLIAALTYSSQLENTLTRSRHLSRETIASLTVPEHAEFAVDGSLVGLTPTLRLDSLLTPGIIVEVKTRPYKPEYSLTLAGYALAFESMYEVPVNHGILLQVNINEYRETIHFYPKIIPLTDGLRMQFIQRRDRLAELLANREDPGMPNKCSPACPYLHYCNPPPNRIADKP